MPTGEKPKLPLLTHEILPDDAWDTIEDSAPPKDYVYQDKIDLLRAGRTVRLVFADDAERKRVTMSLARRAAPRDRNGNPIGEGFKLEHKDPPGPECVRIFRRQRG